MIQILELQRLELTDSPDDQALEWSTWSKCCNGSNMSADNCCN